MVLFSPMGCSKSSIADQNGELTDKSPTHSSEIETNPSVNNTQSIKNGLPWLHNDYEAAIQRAKSLKRPILIDFWAAWCHTCLSMKHGVLADPSLTEFGSSFVWLEVDTESPQSTAVLNDFTITAWPTFLIVSPDGDVLARQLGASSLAEFNGFLKRGQDAFEQTNQPPTTEAASRFLTKADRLAASGQHTKAAAAYNKALENAPFSWTQKSSTILSLMEARYRDDPFEGCARDGDRVLDFMATQRSSLVADFAYWLNTCHEKSGTGATNSRPRLIAMIEATLSDSASKLSFDDRSEALRMLRSLHEKESNPEAARRAALRQKKILDKAVEQAPSPFSAMGFAYHRVDVYQYLGEADTLVPWLESLTSKLPGEYDPPYRLAGLLLGLNNPKDALTFATLSLERAKGPRRANIFKRIATIHQALADLNSAIKAQNEAISIYQQSKPTKRRNKSLSKARTTLNELKNLKNASKQ